MKERPITRVAEEIFRREKRPLHYKELTKMVMLERSLGGRTPYETVRSAIGTDPRFKRVAEGVYALTEWTEYPVARFAKDIAYDVLKSRGEPMAMAALGEAILKERRFAGGPNQVVRNVLRSDKRFYFDPGNQLVGLLEWEMPNQTADSQD
jgi:hypothetical protein